MKQDTISTLARAKPLVIFNETWGQFLALVDAAVPGRNMICPGP